MATSKKTTKLVACLTLCVVGALLSLAFGIAFTIVGKKIFPNTSTWGYVSASLACLGLAQYIIASKADPGASYYLKMLRLCRCCALLGGVAGTGAAGWYVYSSIVYSYDGAIVHYPAWPLMAAVWTDGWALALYIESGRYLHRYNVWRADNPDLTPDDPGEVYH